MFRALLALLATFAATLTRVGRIGIGERGIGQRNGFLEYREFLETIDLGSVATIAVENEDMTVTGVAVEDIVLFVNPAETLVANIVVTALGPVAVANVVRFRVGNPTAGAIDAAAVAFVVGVLRPL